MKWDGKMEHWHDHPDARHLIGNSQIENLPGIPDNIVQRIRRAEARRKVKANHQGLRTGWWPINVRDYCSTYNAANKFSEWECIGTTTINAIHDAIKRLGAPRGVTFSGFYDWEQNLSPSNIPI